MLKRAITTLVAAQHAAEASAASSPMPWRLPPHATLSGYAHPSPVVRRHEDLSDQGVGNKLCRGRTSKAPLVGAPQPPTSCRRRATGLVSSGVSYKLREASRWG